MQTQEDNNMTFFYDLNKRMAELSQKQTLAEHSVPAVQPTKKSPMTQALNERDMGKHNNATTGFAALAKKAGKEYGSKAAGERVAGAQFQKMKKAGKLEEQDMDEAVRGLFYGDQGWQAPTNQAQRDATAKNVKQKRAINRADTRVTGYGNRVEPQQGTKSASGLARRTQPSYGGQETPVDSEKTHPYYSNPKHLDNYGNLQIKPGQGKGVAGGPNMAEEGGIPMTAKQKSFAALAPPKDKITFADKIAGAKQEVEEMLGDVAAEAIKSALSPKQKSFAKLAPPTDKITYADKIAGARKGNKQVADEGFDDMISDVKKRMGPKVGDVKRGARHDIETTATGIRATRRHDDETDEQPTGEKRRAGRPKGADKGPERVTGKAYKHKGGRVKEDGMEDMIEPHDSGEYDREGEMAKDSIKTVVRHAQALEKILGDNDNLPEWVQSKLAKIESMMTAVDDYMQNQEGDDEMAMDEEKTSTRDSRAERAGRKVAKDIEYDEKKKDGIHGKKRGSEDDKAEKAGKRVTKDIEYDEKKKEKKVDETTTSGSVATGGDAPKAGKGGMQVGKGIYDSLNRKLENMISESMSINVSMTKDDNGSHKNITVTAADEDAEMLAQLLRSAGLGGSAAHDHGHEEPCPDCGSTDCGCDEGVAEAYGDTTATQNEPNWPTDTETSDDAMQYSGGLNGPKSTGQTTIPVIAHQGERTGVDDEELRRMMEMAGIDQSKLKPWERTMKEDTIEEAMPATDAQIDPQSTRQYAEKIIKSLDQYTGQGMFDSKYNDDGTITIFKKRDRQWTDDVYRQMGRNPNDPDLKQAGVLTGANMNKAVGPYFDMFRSKGWRFDQPVAGQFTIGVTKAPAMAEGVVDTVKSVVKKGIDALKGPDDDKLLSKLEKETGGKRPEKKDEKMQESLMREFANFKI